jgi:hypothetical protein
VTRKYTSIRRRPPGKPKNVYMIRDEAEGIVEVTVAPFEFALRRVPPRGSITPASPAVLHEYFAEDPIVAKFLKAYDGGRWS